MNLEREREGGGENKRCEKHLELFLSFYDIIQNYSTFRFNKSTC